MDLPALKEDATVLIPICFMMSVQNLVLHCQVHLMSKGHSKLCYNSIFQGARNNVGNG